jgi:hypothetical protein
MDTLNINRHQALGACVRRRFGFGVDEAQKFPVLNAELQISPKDVVLITGELGFGLLLLGSERYVREKLERISPVQVVKLKESFIKNKHPRFKKEFAVSHHQPFGKTSDYVRFRFNRQMSPKWENW